jgi:hypothetical protein
VFEAGSRSVTVPKIPGEQQFLDPLLAGAGKARTRVVARTVAGVPASPDLPAVESRVLDYWAAYGSPTARTPPVATHGP